MELGVGTASAGDALEERRIPEQNQGFIRKEVNDKSSIPYASCYVPRT